MRGAVQIPGKQNPNHETFLAPGAFAAGTVRIKLGF